jgi:hypothetical protein
MIKAKINKQKVIEFWKNPTRSKYDLDLPYNGMLSNCIHCMLKGKSKNQLISKKHKPLHLITLLNSKALVSITGIILYLQINPSQFTL